MAADCELGSTHPIAVSIVQEARRQNLTLTRPKEVEEIISSISSNGGTPLVVCVNRKVTGVIELQDIIKPGIQERFERLRKMGVKTVMVTGDNPLTAKYIAEKAGVDDLSPKRNRKIRWNISRRNSRLVNWLQ